ncbi:MAG: MazG nucleotide pyrophosphohydrolase domain-containing protein, partial [Desulfosalsimonas sp.]
DSSEVTVNWDRLKNGEKGKKGRRSIADGIPASLPALLYALKLQTRAQRAGFDWSEPSQVIGKIREETGELESAMSSGDLDSAADEIGDLVFSAVNLARKIGVDPEAAVRRTNRRFVERFAAIEEAARQRGISPAEMPMEEKERIWQKAK